MGHKQQPKEIPDIVERIEQAHRRFLALIEQSGRLVDQLRGNVGVPEAVALRANIDALKVEIDAADEECERLLELHLETLEDA